MIKVWDTDNKSTVLGNFSQTREQHMPIIIGEKWFYQLQLTHSEDVTKLTDIRKHRDVHEI